MKVFCDRSGECSAGGRLFQRVGPLTAKLRWPVAVWARGTSSTPVPADHRRWRPSTNAAEMQRSLRYTGATARTHFQTSNAVLKTTLWLIRSQCKSSRTGVMCSQRRTPESGHHASSCVLHWLKLLEINFRYSSQSRVAIIQPTVDKWLYDGWVVWYYNYVEV